MCEEDFEKRFEKDLLSSFKCNRLECNIWFSFGTVSIRVEIYWFYGIFGSFWFFLNSRQTVEKIAKKSNAQRRYWIFSHESKELYKISLARLVLARNSNKHPHFPDFNAVFAKESKTTCPPTTDSGWETIYQTNQWSAKLTMNLCDFLSWI